MTWRHLVTLEGDSTGSPPLIGDEEGVESGDNETLSEEMDKTYYNG